MITVKLPLFKLVFVGHILFARNTFFNVSNTALFIGVLQSLVTITVLFHISQMLVHTVSQVVVFTRTESYCY